MDQNAARAVLQEAFPNNHQEVEEYIKEAEHQDGPMYWTEKVRSPEALVQDMQLYLEALDLERSSPTPPQETDEGDLEEEDG